VRLPLKNTFLLWIIKKELKKQPLGDNRYTKSGGRVFLRLAVVQGYLFPLNLQRGAPQLAASPPPASGARAGRHRPRRARWYHEGRVGVGCATTPLGKKHTR